MTGYLPEEWDSIRSAAEFLEMSVEEFQMTGVYVIDFLTQLGAGGYGVVEPLMDPPDPFGPEAIATVWGVEDREVLERVSAGYGVMPEEAQKFGAYLLAFFVGLSGG